MIKSGSLFSFPAGSGLQNSGPTVPKMSSADSKLSADKKEKDFAEIHEYVNIGSLRHCDPQIISFEADTMDD